MKRKINNYKNNFVWRTKIFMMNYETISITKANFGSWIYHLYFTCKIDLYSKLKKNTTKCTNTYTHKKLYLISKAAFIKRHILQKMNLSVSTIHLINLNIVRHSKDKLSAILFVDWHLWRCLYPFRRSAGK